MALKLRPRYPDEVRGPWRWLAVVLASPFFLVEIIRNKRDQRRALRQWRRLGPVQTAQFIVQIVANEPVLRRELREALLRDIGQNARRNRKGRD